MKRREILKQATLASAAAYLTPNWKNQVKSKMTPAAVKPFTFCLNTSTIRGQKQGFLKDLETASAAGYDGVEIWINALQEYSESGRSLSDLKKKIEDWNLQVEDAIGFAQWIVDDKSTRDKAIEQLKNEMDLLAQIGCKRIAAPPAGATNEPGLDLDAAAERYATILDLGKQFGVMPQLEVWGFSKNLYKISQVLYVAAESGHPDAHILPDVYHLYKGGSNADALKLINGPVVEIFHMNDYPANPPRDTIKDADRIYPGDGVAPLNQILLDLYRPGETTILSLELFNPAYWQQDALTVVKTGLEKMKAVTESLGI